MVLYFVGRTGRPLNDTFLLSNSVEHFVFVILILLCINHSFRIGAATWAAAKGFTDTQIRQLGRWKSNAFLNYIRTPSLSTKVA